MPDDAITLSLKLPTVLDTAAAEGLLNTIRDQLQTGSRLRIDASGVETLTFSCVQIVLAASKSGIPVSVERPSEVFVDAFTDLGLNWADWSTPHPLEEGESAAPAPANDAVKSCEETEERSMTKRILTIDDSKTIRDMLLLTLADAGFEVLQAVDGQDGMEVLGKERFDVVITDINMPRMDGYEVIRQMRRNPAHKSTPILVLTTESEAEKRNLAREAGATGWMVKPFDPDRLIATINKVAP